MKSISLWLTGHLAGREVCGEKQGLLIFAIFPRDPGSRFLAETVSCISRNIHHSISSMYISIWISCNSTLPYSLKLSLTACKFVVVYLLVMSNSWLLSQCKYFHTINVAFGLAKPTSGEKGKRREEGGGEWAQGGEMVQNCPTGAWVEGHNPTLFWGLLGRPLSALPSHITPCPAYGVRCTDVFSGHPVSQNAPVWMKCLL